jgi:hypothetical protein
VGRAIALFNAARHRQYRFIQNTACSAQAASYKSGRFAIFNLSNSRLQSFQISVATMSEQPGEGPAIPDHYCVHIKML